jgi:hypothetical protein
MKTSQELEQQIAELQKELEIVKEKEQEKSEFLPEGFKREGALNLLYDPKGIDMDHAFQWESTPQGSTYWEIICDDLYWKKITKLPDDAIIQIQQWVITSYRKQLGE